MAGYDHIDHITVRGFKSIRAIEKLELRSINMIIGSNGSGKSNFIEVFTLLNAIRSGSLNEYALKAGGAERLLHFGSKVTDEIFVHVFFDNEKNQYSIRLEPTEQDELVPTSEYVYFWDKTYPSPYSDNVFAGGKEAGISSAGKGIPKYIRWHLDRLRVYHFHDTGANSPMKKTADLNDNRFLRRDAGNLASFLYLLSQKFPDYYRKIQRTVRMVVPFFDDFILEPLQLNKKKIRLEWKHTGSDEYFDVSALSDGTIRFIALAALFLQPDELSPSIILVDEPELGLHPFALNILASLIKQSAVKRQVIVSTQSALLLDYFTPEDVLVADRVDDATVLKRLSTEELGVWLEDYSLGELWEKNRIGGRPS